MSRSTPEAVTAAQAKKALNDFADKQRAAHARRYFKTGKGEYGAGDKFIGARVPEVRQVAGKFKDLPLSENIKLLHSPVHEQRLLALIILAKQFQRARRDDDQQQQSTIYHYYLEQYPHINNWDLVDTSCRDIVGGYLLDKSRNERRLLYHWARSDHLWKKRIAMIATAAFINAGRFQETLEIAEILIDDEHDLIHKASGWMLRELGKKDRTLLQQFLDRNVHRMPRTMLRYAIEKLPEKIRKNYLDRKPA